MKLLGLLLGLILAGSAPAQVLYVDDTSTGANDGTSWQDAFTDLQSALAVAASSDQVWVARGTYRPTSNLDRSVSFDLRCQVYGGFDGTETTLTQRAGLFEETVLSGDLLGDDGPGFTGRVDNSLHVATVDDLLGFDVLLDGFTVRGGHSDADLYSPGGGLLVAYFAWGVRVRNCTFTDCYAARGGGIGCPGKSPVWIERCAFIGNRARFYGGGVDGGTNTEIRSSRFLGNRAGRDGGGLHHTVLAVDCAFSGNVAVREGGGTFLAWRIVNGTFSRNIAGLGGGAAGGYPWASGRLESCVLWGNSDATGGVLSGQVAGYLELDDCVVQGWDGSFAGSGTIDADPLFRDPLGPDGIAGTEDDDLRLERGSPCIDTGSMAGYPGLGIDAIGRARFVDALACDGGGVLDRGALERQVVDADTVYCTSTPSSLGAPAGIAGSCVASVAGGPFPVTAQPVPDGRAFLLVGAPGSELPFGDGTLCLAGRFASLGPVVPAVGIASFLVDPGTSPANAHFVPGATVGVQVLFRDAAAGGAGFNLSSAMRLLALP